MRQRVRDAKRAAGREWRRTTSPSRCSSFCPRCSRCCTRPSLPCPPSPRPTGRYWPLASLETARSNFFAPLGVVESPEKGLRLVPCGESLAILEPTALWMRELGTIMNAHGLDNKTAVLVGAQQQLYMLDESPRARVGEIVSDPSAGEFPVRLYRVSTTSSRVRPSPASPTSSTRTCGPLSATRSSSPQRLASEGDN